MALILALAALLVFAPVARADIERGAHPYRDVVNPSSADSEVAPSDDDGDDDGDDEDVEDEERSGDDGDDDDEDDEDDEDEGSDDDDGSSDDEGSDDNPSTDDQQQTGPTTSAVPGGVGSWVWLLLVALAAIAAGTGYVLWQRRNRNR